MTRLLAALILVAASPPALAIERHVSTGMNCAEVQRRVDNAGAAIMRYPSTRVPNLTLYGRYVRNGGFCRRGEAAEEVYIPAADTRSCPVLECKTVDFDDPMLILPRR